MAAPLFDAGRGDFAVLADDDEDEHLAFQPAGDCFLRIELPAGVELLEVLADRLGPGFRGNGRSSRVFPALGGGGFAGVAAGLGCSGRINGGGGGSGVGGGSRRVTASGRLARRCGAMA